MNIQEYIASGIIEAYLMGLATEPERAEFERLCTLHPELVAARRDMEQRLEEQALEQAILPPPEVKVKVLEAIGNLNSRKGPSINPPKIVTMENSNSPVRSSGWLRLVAAASVILLIGMAFLYYRTATENNDLSTTNNRLNQKLNSVDSLLDRITKEEKIVKDPNTTVVNMVGTQVAPRSSANIYWDSTSANVYLVVKNMRPGFPSDQPYQLWALIDGKPKRRGCF